MSATPLSDGGWPFVASFCAELPDMLKSSKNTVET
jgi:hypothetical protein